jgi:peptidoglycan biosynthesis protein MviN/MurJ (putative lipid II flippase)
MHSLLVVHGVVTVVLVAAAKLRERRRGHAKIGSDALSGWTLAVLVSLTANLLLVPEYGARGAAVAAVLANTSLVVFMLIRSQRVFHVDYELLRLARPIALTALACAAAYALPTGTGLDSWASRWVHALAWPLLLVASGFVTPPERERIVRLVRRRRGAGVA